MPAYRQAARRVLPAVSALTRRASRSGVRFDGLPTGHSFPTTDNYVAIGWLDFHDQATSIELLSGHEGRTGTTKKVQHCIARITRVQQSIRDQGHGFLRRMIHIGRT